MKTDNSYDVIVVGSGPGGATVAKEMAQRGKKVLIVEWGNKAPIRGWMTQFAMNAFIPGKSALFTNNFLAMVRAIVTGGSTVYYYGTAFDPPVDMLKSHGIDITKEIEEIRKELPTSPLPDSLIGPMANRIMESAQDLGYDWKKMPKFIYPDKCKPDCFRCNYGCPEGAKWGGQMFVDEALGNNAEIINKAKVTKVIIENNKAVGVEYKQKRKVHQAFAPLVVVSAGGIGSPMILRESGIEGAGYDYFFDPLITVMGAVDDIKGGREIPMATGIHMDDEGYVMTDMTVPFTINTIFNAETFRFDQLHNHKKTLSIMVKAKDSLGGKLSKRGGVRKKLAEKDKNKLFRGYARAREILANAGAKDIRKSWYLAAHPGGTVKVGEFLDSNLKTEFDNLYVCDCSVIPEAWGLPPTFTLVALGKRLVKHLTGETIVQESERETAELTEEITN
jgi:choline dehydrogenase-like flavoprotein